MFKKIAIGLAAIIALILIIAATKPDSMNIERSAVIQASPQTVHALINDFHKWGEWSPWEKLDPDMQRKHEGASNGVGAIYSWQGNGDVGAGRMEIVESSASKIVIKLDFTAPMEANNVTEFLLIPQDGKTDVRWSMSGPVPFMSKVMQVFMDIDAMVGKDFEKGLADLKVAAEKSVQTLFSGVPAGNYTLEKSHAQLLFRVDHVGFSMYTGTFKRFDAQLQFDPNNLSAATVTATIDPRSLDVVNPPAGFIDTLIGAEWLDSKQYPQMSFKSTRVEQTSINSVRVTGDFTLHGVTKPVTLNATFNGGYAGMAQFDPNARIGFSARGVFNRSDFGITYGIPEAGSKMGVSDAVEFLIEAEFTGPPMKTADPK